MGANNPQETRFAKNNLLLTFEEQDKMEQNLEKSAWLDINQIPDNNIVHIDFDFHVDVQNAVAKIAKNNSVSLVNGKTEKELFDEYLSKFDENHVYLLAPASVNRAEKMGFQYHLTWNNFSEEIGYKEKWKRAFYNKKSRESKKRGKTRQSEYRKMAKKFNNFLQTTT
jgi:hypothetical protein